MKYYEKGILSDSKYYHFYPSNITKSLYYYMLSIGHFYAQNGYSISRQDGKAPLILLIIKGHLHIIYNEKEYTAKSSQIVLIDCNKPHVYYCDKYCSFQFIHFSGNNSEDIVSHLIVQNGSPIFDSAEYIDLYSEIDTCISLLDNQQIISEIKLSQILYTCICILQASNEVYLERISDSSSIITATINYIKNNLHKTITLMDLADHVNISTYHFSHLFKRELDISPIKYVSMTKINHAKTILLTSNSSINEISDSLGYSSSSSFINAFRLRVGISPQKYRQQEIEDAHSL